MRPDATHIARALDAAGVRSAQVDEVDKLGVVCRVDASDVTATLTALKTGDHDFAFLADLFGIDTGEAVDVVYHLRSFSRDEELHVRSTLPYGGDLASVWVLYPAALMAEREVAEMFGLTLSGHPNPKRLLTTDQVPPLLLKSVAIRGAEEVRNR